MDDQDGTMMDVDVVDDKQLLEDSKTEAGKLDVLVCGSCHEVFHFIEELKDHRVQRNCPGKSALSDEQAENKHQIWAFILWKNAKFKDRKEDDKHSSWTIYQKWCALDEKTKEKYLTAARKVQYLYKIANLKTVDSLKVTEKGKIIKINSDDLLQSTADSEVELNESEVEIPPRPQEKRRGRPPIKPNKGMRTSNDGKAEFVVERIVAKRFQPKLKTFEYLIKWENFNQSENTWEPAGHLHGCKRLVDEFERKLEEMRKLKAQKQQMAAKGKEPIVLGPGGRPVRSSKQRAMSQVKQWVGTMSDNEEDNPKRLFSGDSGDDSDEGFEKRLKLEQNSSDSENEKPQVTIKKLSKSMTTALNNGSQTRKLPDNILVPDANGIVRINQKQLPNLSTGVYVMSKTAGIIKLDSDTSKIAASGGHAVIKVAPRIGQTSIKIIRKDAQNGGKVTTTKTKVPTIQSKTSPVPVHRASVTEPKRIIKPNTKEEPKEVKELQAPDEDSDGLEEMEFPSADMPIPPPESPPGEFVLCPLTGKIAGKDYSTVTEEIPTTQKSSSASDLVNLAAAEIIQDAAGNQPIKIENIKKEQDSIAAVKSEASSTSFKSSILSTALSNANIPTTPTPKKPTTTILTSPQPTRQKVTPLNRGILNRTIPPRPSPQAIITRIMPAASPIRPRSTVSATSTPRATTRIVQQAGIHHISRPGMHQTSPSTRTILMGPRPTHHVVSQPQVRQIVRTVVPPHHGGPTTIRRIIRTTPGPQPVQHQHHPSGAVVRTLVRRPQPAQAAPQHRVTTYQVRQQVQHVQPVMSKPVSQTTVVSKPAPVKPTQVLQQQQQTVHQIANVVTTTSAAITHSPQQIVSMPSLTDDQPTLVAASSASTSTTVSQPQQSSPDIVQLNKNVEEQQQQPLLITGEDGTIYQVAGHNEDGQTILITQGEDGEQQCLLVAPENMPEMNQAIAAATASANAANAAQTAAEAQQSEEQSASIANATQQVAQAEEATEADESQVVAQIVSAQPPSPGGTRKVVLMLPDGNFMMTEVTADQYAALELDK